MVQTQQVKSGGVELVAVHDLVGGLEAELVGRSIGGSRLDPATSEPSGEATPVVVPSLGVLPLGGWLAPELGGADDEGILEHAPRLKVLEQSGGTGIEDGSPVAVVAGEVLVAVPVGADLFRSGVLSPAVYLHEAYPPLDEPAGKKALSAEGSNLRMIDLVEFLGGFGFPLEACHFGSA